MDITARPAVTTINNSFNELTGNNPVRNNNNKPKGTPTVGWWSSHMHDTNTHAALLFLHRAQANPNKNTRIEFVCQFE